MTIDILSDDIFQEIFAFCLRTLPDPYWFLHANAHMKAWQALVHVCQRWRQIIYASPLYFNLQLYCANQTPFMKHVGRWPEFPLVVRYNIPEDEDDLIAALKHPDRIHRVDLNITSPYWGEVFVLMQVPFLALSHLKLEGPEDPMADLPDGFLGGSAPCLQHLEINSMSIPGLRTLLLSARDLVSLQLGYTPTNYCYGYISPETMVEGLAVLTNLRTLRLGYPPPIPLDKQRRRRPNPPMLAVLPALTEFEFAGNCEYLEDFLAQIDMPRVHDVIIIYSGEEQVQTSQLSQFIGRTANLKLAQFRRALVTFQFAWSHIRLDLPQGECRETCFVLSTPDQDPISPVQSMVHLLGQLITMLSNVNHLSVGGHDVSYSEGQNISESAEWLPLLRLFPAVEVMEVRGELAGSVASALEDAAEEMVTVLLPALQVLWLTDDKENKTVGSTERFLSLRQLSGRPVTIVNTEDEFVERLNASGCAFVLFD